ncbi:hypothetical protein VTI74DRAFT_2594 [Chaetomium olivicolor]
MAAWKRQEIKSGKLKSAVSIECVSVSEVEEVEDSTNSHSIKIQQYRPRGRKRLWFSYSLAALLTVLAIIFGVGFGNSRSRYVSGRDSKEDPFGNWGKAGTGTEELAWYPHDFLRDVTPVPCHSHNDYWRRVPLFSAIYAGCTGVEADVWLQNGDLLVGHDKGSLQVNRTLQSLYIEPLVEILTRQNPTTPFYNGTKNGVFSTDPSQTLVLLIDLKTDGLETWPVVTKQLTPLRDKGWLSYSKDGVFYQGPITVVGTGNTPFDLILGENTTRRDTFYDAPLDQLELSPYNSTNSYYASVSFWDTIGAVWWKGEPSDGQLTKIKKQLREAHDRGLKARYWKLPSWPIHVRNRVWEVLVQEGIDMLNVDDLDAATRQDWTTPETF